MDRTIFMEKLYKALIWKRRDNDKFGQLIGAVGMALDAAILAHYSSDDYGRKIHTEDFERYLKRISELTEEAPNGNSQ